ncbi:hypothetical protein HYALB_00011856 [Hymenoscyphus albidus]|uniref:Nephrocystin 3-like N-terminal domain-containing protein n=1 Tax=Hymenoscyphus albidus TaxID=595503 RepID=A0A9N9M0W7_9HELO|nr:hypothetical protein HYALB_00011856 [Hymenoscyphus albidus]
MDALSVLSLATAIITCIDFTGKLVLGSVEIYQNGRIKENDSLNTVFQELDSIVKGLEINVSMNTVSERRIFAIAEKCREDSKTLLGMLKSMELPPGTKDILKCARRRLAYLKDKKKLDEFKGKLQENRAELMLNLQVALREGQSQRAKSIASLSESYPDLEKNLTRKIDELGSDLSKAIEQRNASITSNEWLVGSFSDLSNQIKDNINDFHSLATDIPTHHRILRQLAYNGMESRRSKITLATSTTRRWVFEHPISSNIEDYIDDSDESRNSEFDDGDSDFDSYISPSAANPWIETSKEAASYYMRNWLRKGHGVFHIMGNAGLGKSTLMKYIAQHEYLQLELSPWSGKMTLVIADFYFWLSGGSEFQKSRQGMCRTLLFQILSSHPQLMQRLFPRQWKALNTPGDAMVETQLLFREEAIEDAFKNFLNSRIMPDYKFCFFIDGLDEYEGSLLDREELAQDLKKWTSNRNIKLCVSSRSYPEFSESFECPYTQKIELHHLNMEDIHMYCSHKFVTDKHGQRLDDSVREKVIRKITENAQGVFLWAYLVVDQLLEALRSGLAAYELLETIDQIPCEMEDYYTKLLKPDGKNKLSILKAKRMLLLAVDNPFPWDLGQFPFPGLADLTQITMAWTALISHRTLVVRLILMTKRKGE